MIKYCKVCGKRLILLGVGSRDVFCSKECLVKYFKTADRGLIPQGIPLEPHFTFRSKWEEAFAQFCTQSGLRWRYEPYAYKLVNGKYYIPDFLVEGKFVEIKGVWEAGSKRKVRLFEKDYAKVLVLTKPLLKYIGVL